MTMDQSCHNAPPSISSTSLGATVAITAAISAGVGSLVTAMIIKRRRRRRTWRDREEEGEHEHPHEEDEHPHEPQSQSPPPLSSQQSLNNNNNNGVVDELTSLHTVSQSISKRYYATTQQRRGSQGQSQGDTDTNSCASTSMGLQPTRIGGQYQCDDDLINDDDSDGDDDSVKPLALEQKTTGTGIGEFERTTKMTSSSSPKPASFLSENNNHTIVQSQRRKRRASIHACENPNKEEEEEDSLLAPPQLTRGYSQPTPSLRLKHPPSRRLSVDNTHHLHHHHHHTSQKRSSHTSNISEEETYISETELKFKGEPSFDTHVIPRVSHDLLDTLHLLRRTRAISALSNRLMAAPDESTCIEEVTRLLVLMFRVERVSFGMLTGSEHFLLKRVNVVRRKGVADDGGEAKEDTMDNNVNNGGGGTTDGNSNDENMKQQLQQSPSQAATTGASTSSSSSSSFDLQYLDSDYQRPLAGTAAGVCASTLKEHYTPRTQHSTFDTHRVFYQNGKNTVLVSPILVNGGKCAGCIMLSKEEVDAFPKSDRVLIADIGLLLGANIYAKRLLKTAEESKKRSREMLHAFIPPKVLEKIECYWDANSEEYKERKEQSTAGSSGSGSGTCSTTSSIVDSVGSHSGSGSSGVHQQQHHHRRHRRCTSSSISANNNNLIRTNSWFVAQTDWTADDIADTKNKHSNNNHNNNNDNDNKHNDSTKGGGVEGSIQDRIQMIKNMNRLDDDINFVDKEGTTHMIVQTDGMMEEFAPISRALYAESVKNVCIIFTDIVGFSRISMGISPTDVMDMLQDLFFRFDELCDVHGVLKLETIGDAYICATNLLEDDEDGVQDAAIRALTMAKDMVFEATNVRIPSSDTVDLKTLQIRVGIHIGDVTCGVLGQRLPKFTTCGTAVNMAARMEQTSSPGRIRVTKDFHDIVGDTETCWDEKEVIELKNMGHMETYLLDPIESRMREVSDITI